MTVESILSMAGKAIAPVAAATPALGSPTSAVVCGLTAGGCYRSFQGGAVNWTPGTGAVATLGAIRAAWGAVGYEKGKLGYPTGRQLCGLAGGGLYQTFQGGTIHWSAATGAFATWGPIRATWASLNYEKGKLGYPSGKETCGLINGGCYQTFRAAPSTGRPPPAPSPRGVPFAPPGQA